LRREKKIALRLSILNKTPGHDEEALLYYLFATKFHMTPDQVDDLPLKVIEKMILVDSAVRELEERELRKAR